MHYWLREQSSPAAKSVFHLTCTGKKFWLRKNKRLFQLEFLASATEYSWGYAVVQAYSLRLWTSYVFNTEHICEGCLWTKTRFTGFWLTQIKCRGLRPRLRLHYRWGNANAHGQQGPRKPIALLLNATANKSSLSPKKWGCRESVDNYKF